MIKQQKIIVESWPFILGLITGIYFITLTITGLDFSFYPGDLGDARFNIYILEHGYRFFIIGDVPTANYWDAPFAYPQESIITFSDNLLGIVPIYSLFRMLGYDFFTSFQLLFFTLTILNYSSAYLFFNWLLKNKYAATMGALVFAFSIALYGQMTHAQTFPRFCIPLAFLFACKFYKTLSAKHFFLTVFFVVYQFYCALYLGFMLMVPISIMLVSTGIIRLKWIIKENSYLWLLRILGGLAINILIMLPLILPYMNSPALSTEVEQLGYADYEDTFTTIPLIKSFYFIYAKTYWWESLEHVATELPFSWDHQLFPGSIVLISCCFLLLYLLKKLLTPTNKWNGLQISLILSTLITFLLFTRTESFSFYEYLLALPGFASMRSIGRIINVEMLFFGLAVAVTVYTIIKQSKYQGLVFILLLIFFIPDNYIYSEGYIRENKQDSRDRMKYLEKEISQTDSDKIICFQSNSIKNEVIHYQLDAMLASQKYGRKTINGYTSNCPKDYTFCGSLDSHDRKYWTGVNKIAEEELAIIYQNFDFELDNMINNIYRNKEWMDMIRKQAIDKNISFEKNVRDNAIWMINEKRNKK